MCEFENAFVDLAVVFLFYGYTMQPMLMQSRGTTLGVSSENGHGLGACERPAMACSKNGYRSLACFVLYMTVWMRGRVRLRHWPCAAYTFSLCILVAAGASSHRTEF